MRYGKPKKPWTDKTDFIPKIRIQKEIKEGLYRQAAKERVTLSEHVRLVLTRLVLMEK